MSAKSKVKPKAKRSGASSFTSTETAAKTLPVPEAGRRYFGLGKNASYAAANRGEIPTIKIGKLMRVPVVALERMLNEARPEAQK